MEVVIVLTLAAHLLAVNVASAGPLVAIWLHRRAIRGDQAADYAGRALAWLSFYALLMVVILGVALLGLGYYTHGADYFSTWRMFRPAKIWFSLAEIACSLAWTLAYAATWNRLKGHPNWHALLGLLTATNLLYHFPPMLAAVSIAQSQPELAAQLTTLSTSGWLQNPQIASRVVHVWLACLAVTGVVLMAIAARAGRSADVAGSTEPKEASTDAGDAVVDGGFTKIIVGGGRLALFATLMQLLVGMWVLLSVSDAARNSLLGGNAVPSLLFAGGVMGSLLLLHLLTAIAMGETERRIVRNALLLITMIVVLMTSALRHV